MAQISWSPSWTTPVKIESGGRYPLALNRFHGTLQDLLIKSITYNGNRLRNITFFCWAIGNIQKHEDCNDYADFVSSFNRRETAMSMGLYLNRPNYRIAGSAALGTQQPNQRDEYDCNFSVMQSNELGTYGLYYSGTLFNLGLVETDENHVHRLTVNGERLYEAAEQRYRHLSPEYYRSYFGKQYIGAAVLKEWGVANDLDGIRNDDARAEREIFKEIIFRTKDRSPADYRKDSFALYMHLIKACYQMAVDFDEDILRDIHYYGSLDTDPKTFIQIPDYFKECDYRWYMYEGHVYFRGWTSTFFKCFLEYLKGSDVGGTVSGFFESIDPAVFNDEIHHLTGHWKDYYTGRLEDITSTLNDLEDINSTATERNIGSDTRDLSRTQILARFATVMSCLYLRFESERKNRVYNRMRSSLLADLWFDKLYEFGNFKTLQTKDFLRTFLKRNIINQHDLIMFEKTDLRRCWFTTEGQRYFFKSDTDPIWRSANFSTIIMFLLDMGLIDKIDGLTKLTTEGESFYNSLIAEFYNHG